MEAVAVLPHLNAALNATCFVFLVSGFAFIKNKRVEAHRVCMIGALTTSIVFLISYVTYHWEAGSRPFMGTGFIRPVYYVILFTHVVLAAVIVPLAIVTLRRAIKGDIERHRKIARWTWPLWIYVSVTGLIVYGMLYHLYA